LERSSSLPPLLLSPSIQRYAWGDPAWLPSLLGAPQDGAPWAEAWYGAHPFAPSLAHGPQGATPLDQALAPRLAELLGPALAAEHAALPFLMKIIAAHKPLSIQVHPSAAQAREGFDREERAGIPFQAPHRSYRDPFPKPEILVALTDVHALCGFRAPAEIAAALGALPEIAALLPPFQPGPSGLRALLEAYFALPLASLRGAWARVLERLQRRQEVTPFDDHTPEFWALHAHRTLDGAGPPDRGLLFVFLLGLLHLRPGQAIFLAAGVPHAYLRGSGVELMTSSDNVLRAGLTPKHIDPGELLRVVRLDARCPEPLDTSWDDTGAEGVFLTPTGAFELRCLRLGGGGPVERRAEGPEMLLALPRSGVVRVVHEGGALEVARGQGCLLPHGLRYRIEAEGEVYLARVPRPGASPSFRGRRPAALAFGTSGLRGLVTDITDLEAYLNTRGFLDFLVDQGEAVPGTPVALAGDLRPSTDSEGRSILRAVARAIQDACMEPLYYGRIPTPALMYQGLRLGCPSVMVTGSHIPFDRNGIKFNKSDGEVLKTDEGGILAAVERAREREYRRGVVGSLFDDAGWFRPGASRELPGASDEARRGYVERYLGAFPAGALGGLRVALYEHSAVGREVVAEVLRGLGAEVIPVGRSERFVAIDTEALSEAHLAQLQALVDEVRGAHGEVHALVSTDGDSDRPLVLGVEPGGQARFCGGDVLGTLVAEALGADAVAVPVSASDVVDLHFQARGVPVTRTRVGSPWVIAAMKGLRGERRVGWEANGGFLTGSTLVLPAGPLAPLPTRDAVLPLVAVLHAMQARGGRLSALVDALPRRFSRSGLLDQVDPVQSRASLERFRPSEAPVLLARFEQERVRWSGEGHPEQDAAPALATRLLAIRGALGQVFDAASGFGAIEELNLVDGLRIRFSGGEVAHVRPSGNAPQLRIYAVASDEARAEAIVALALAEPGGLLRRLLAGEGAMLSTGS
jgi:phosphomannomutase